VNGSVVINGGTGTFTLTANNDSDSANEAFQIDVRTGSTAGSIVASNGSVSVVPAPIQFVGYSVVTQPNLGVSSYTVPTTGLVGGIDTQARTGDLIIVATGWNFDSDGNPGVLDNTLTWNEVADIYVNVGSDDTHLSVNWAYASVEPPATISVSATGSTTYTHGTIVYVFRNTSSNAMDVTPTTAVATTGSNIPNPPAITPATTGAVVVAIGFTAQSDSSQDITSAPTDYTGFAVFNERSSLYDLCGAIAHRQSGITAGVSENPGTFGITSYATASWAAVTLCIKSS
jgi:hypothetical protein